MHKKKAVDPNRNNDDGGSRGQRETESKRWNCAHKTQFLILILLHFFNGTQWWYAATVYVHFGQFMNEGLIIRLASLCLWWVAVFAIYIHFAIANVCGRNKKICDGAGHEETHMLDNDLYIVKNSTFSHYIMLNPVWWFVSYSWLPQL